MREVDLDKIRKMRKKHKMSQKDMAAVIGSKSVYPYHRKEIGVQSFTAEEIYAIANFFNKPIEYFFTNSIAKSASDEKQVI